MSINIDDCFLSSPCIVSRKVVPSRRCRPPASKIPQPAKEVDVGHKLRPRTGNLPSAKDVARHLATEFAFVRSDEVDGMRQARERANWIEKAPAHIFLGRHQEALEAARRLKDLTPGEALTIEFGDAPDRTKRIVVIPGEPINFGYDSKDDEVASKDLVERCAQALDCEAVLF
jgi:hypothetical protein